MEKEQLIALVEESQSGNKEAMERLLRYAHTSVSYQCRKMLNNAQDAEDMTQEVLVTIYTKLDTLHEPAAFHKWVARITSSRCINALHRTHVECQFAEDEEGHSILDTLEELDEQVIPDKAIDNAETVRMIEQIVGSLPDLQRAATLMFYYNEMSVKEIARTMEVSENTVKSRLNYARKAIKEKVLDYEKQGVKLYGLSPLPFLLYFLRLAAQKNADKEAAGIMVAEVMAAESAAVVAGMGSIAAAAGTTVPAGGVGVGVFAGISAKVAAGALAAVVAVCGVIAAVTPNTREDAAVSAVSSANATTEATTDLTIEDPTTVTESESVHQHEYQSVVTAPTCSSGGYTTYTCDCGDSYTGDQTPASHAYTGTVTQPPTCSWPGVKTYTCRDCGYSYEETVPKNEHVWSEWTVKIEPTATTYGKKVRTCELCYGAQEANIEPTGSAEDGSGDCPACGVGDITQVVLSEPTCESRGEVAGRCGHCGYISGYSYPPAKGHTVGVSEDGQYEICTVCGAVLGPTGIGHGGVTETEPAEDS